MRDRLKRSFWCVISIILLSDSCAGALLDRRRGRRGIEDDLGNMVRVILDANDQTQVNYVRSGLQRLEEQLDGSLGELDDAQDRIFLGSVQSLITSLQTILNDPTQTPAALASLATDPSNLLVLITLMVSTAFAAQLSAFTLFGEPDSQSNRGLLGVVLDFLTVAQNSMENDDMDMDSTNTSETEETTDKEETETEEMEDTENDDNEEILNYDSEDAENEEIKDTVGSNGGLIESFISFINSFLGGNSNDNDMGSEGGMENGEDIDDENTDENTDENEGLEEDDSTDGGSSFGGFSLSLHPIDFIGIFGGTNDNDTMEDNGDMEETLESEDEDSGLDDNRDETDASDGGSSFGGVSVSMHPIDLAALFVQVQNSVGMNCSCADGDMMEEAITGATLRLVKEAKRRKIKKFRKITKKNKKNKKKKQILKIKKNSQKTKQ